MKQTKVITIICLEQFLILLGLIIRRIRIIINDPNLHQAWYVLNESDQEYFFTPVNGLNLIPIDQLGWGSLRNGNLRVTFYVNDTFGNTAIFEVSISKELPEEPFDQPTISFGNYFLLSMILGFLGLLMKIRIKREITI
jgi:hypothetical protein